MATLGDLKERIISETTRDDLADDMASQFSNIIAKSIEQYAAERWWFNERRVLIPTIIGQAWVTWPTDCRWIDGFYLEQNSGNSRWPISVRSIDEWEALTQPSTTGQPTDYLVADTRLRLFPAPNAIYSLALDYIADVTPVLAADTDSNLWTNQGQDLITAQSKIRLYRDYLSATVQDPRLLGSMAAEKDAYSRLRAESSRRTATGRVMPGW